MGDVVGTPVGLIVGRAVGAVGEGVCTAMPSTTVLAIRLSHSKFEEAGRR